jgi:HEAT repeat protein
MDRMLAFTGTPFSDRVLWFLILLILVFLGLAVLLVGLTFLLRLRNEREARLWNRLQSEWGPLLLEVLDDPDRLGALWGQVLEKDSLRFLEFILPYAQRMGGRELDTLRRAAEPFLPEVLDHLHHRQVGTRARAVQILGTLGLPRFVDEVKAAIQDPSPFVAAIAARLLAHGLGAEMASDLCRSLTRFETFRIWYLVDMVSAMGPDAIPVLRETLLGQGLPARTRAVAAHSLAALRDLGSADLSAELALREDDPELLAALLQLLSQVGTSKHAGAARAHVESGEFFVAAAAIRTLSELGGEEDLPTLIEKLTDASAWVRMAAARGVYRLGGKAVLSALVGSRDPAAPLFRQVLAEESGR